MMSPTMVVITLLAAIIWGAVSKESVKPAKEINWKKMIPLLTVGSAFTLVITISLFQSLPF